MKDKNNVRTMAEARRDFTGELLEVEELESNPTPGAENITTAIVEN